MLLTIPEFINTLPRRKSEETIRRWIRAGKIEPQPKLFGREYLILDTAILVNSSPEELARKRMQNRIFNGNKYGKKKNTLTARLTP
ncbi:excisionase-like domain-containing protein [Serratia symbiotica str. Tucson]|uniref:Excisionase-like domain-containing protein n=2 Tax=Serratia symbiotica TaxID=138074 RepID=E9CKR2_9GAMM|nr:excisionase-like domain-containing protein [Serratia symbiotica str. Tucson]BBI92797.1 excisionase-like domain-containing protein [Serratia symbiotica]